MKPTAKHKFCRRIGYCLWGDSKCPSVKRPFPPGQTAKSRRRKLSTYGELLQEKQILRRHYAISEKQLRIAYAKAKTGEGKTGDKLFVALELRLDSFIYRSGLAPSIFAAKQVVNHRHVYLDGKKVDRCSYRVKPGQVVSLNESKSPAVADSAKKTNIVIPPYMSEDKEKLSVTLEREPLVDEIPFNIDVAKVVEYYAR